METLVEKSSKEIFKEFSIKSGRYAESSLINSLRELRNYSPLPYEAEKKEFYIKSLVREWFSYRMRRKYEELSPEIFELKREIEIDAKHFTRRNSYRGNGFEKIKIEIPMLARARLDKDKGWSSNIEAEYPYEISLSSRMPRIPLEVRRAGMEALGYAYKTFGDALATEVLGEIIMEKPDYAPQPKDAELLVLWKPRASEIHVEAKILDDDPALVLKWDRPYLVTTWKEPEEEPFMRLITACKLPNLDEFLVRK